MKSILPTLLALAGCGNLTVIGSSTPEGGEGSDSTSTTTPAGDPGRVTLHRLNRTEYNNTVRDLLGTSLAPADGFPWDDTSYGFDNIADTLTVSPLHVELYEKAATDLATEAVELPLAEMMDERIEAEGPDAVGSVGAAGADAWNLWSNGELTALFELPADGRYELSTRVWADQAGGELALMGLGVDGLLLDTFEVSGSHRDEGQTFTLEADLQGGVHAVQVSFLNDYWDPDLGEDRNLHVDWVAVRGPTDLEPGPNPIRESLFTCTPTSDTDSACARTILGPFVDRAWRRPATSGELDALVGLFTFVTADGGTFDDGIRVALTSILLSPHFVYRVELDPDPTSDEPGLLSDWEIASRLSYFLWSTMPDDALLAAAEAGTLNEPDELARQVERMLSDPRAEALVQNFAGQWLFIRGIQDKSPDPWEFPEFDEELRASMQGEMERFFRSFTESERSLRELLTATEGEVDARLAAHYDLPAVSDWTPVDLASAERGGLLGQAGLLMVNSYPARTSPVLRGKWVLSQLLCSEPDPPPAGVEGLIEDDADAESLRDQLEQHRQDPLCASCHDAMDPLGFAMEHYDGIGAWRDRDGDFPVDASGELPNGVTFYGARELSAILADDRRYPACIAEKLFTYALGRAPALEDEAALGDIQTRFDESGLLFRELATAIVQSDPFRFRRGEP